MPDSSTSATSESFSPGASRLGELPFVTVLAVFVPTLVTGLVSYLLRPLTGSVYANFPMFGFLIYGVCNWIVIGAGYVLLRRRRITWSDIGFANFRWRDLGYAFIATLIGLYVVYPLSNLLTSWLGLKAMSGMGYSLPGPANIISAILLPGVLIPLGEDIIFRGFLLTYLRGRLQSLWFVGFIGTVFFTLIHGYFGWAGIVFILFWAPLTVTLFLWRRSIYPSYFMHVLNNFFVYVAVPLFFR